MSKKHSCEGGCESSLEIRIRSGNTRFHLRLRGPIPEEIALAITDLILDPSQLAPEVDTTLEPSPKAPAPHHATEAPAPNPGPEADAAVPLAEVASSDASAGDGSPSPAPDTDSEMPVGHEPPTHGGFGDGHEDEEHL